MKQQFEAINCFCANLSVASQHDDNKLANKQPAIAIQIQSVWRNVSIAVMKIMSQYDKVYILVKNLKLVEAV